MQRRLARVSTELARTDTELLCERAHSQHLAQERQEVADRERSLSRQVDVAVMVIAAMREQLNASENELERRERWGTSVSRGCRSEDHRLTCGAPVFFQGGDNHPEVPGGGRSAGNEWEGSDPALHREPAGSDRPGREAGGVLPGQQRRRPVGTLQGGAPHPY